MSFWGAIPLFEYKAAGGLDRLGGTGFIRVLLKILKRLNIHKVKHT